MTYHKNKIIKFYDSSNEYQSRTKTFSVDRNTKSKIFIQLNKWITFKSRVKGKQENLIKSAVVIKSQKGNIHISKTTDPSNPLKIALPVGLYDISFDAGYKYQPLTLTNIDISRYKEVVGELEFQPGHIRTVVREQDTEMPVKDVEIFINNKIVGKTNNYGLWEGNLAHGITTIKVYKEGYIEQIIEKDLGAGDKLLIPVLLFRKEKLEETK